MNQDITFQIDIIYNSTEDKDLFNLLNTSSDKHDFVEETENEPKLVRWWFKDIKTALRCLYQIKHDISHRLISVDNNALFIQIGNFKL